MNWNTILTAVIILVVIAVVMGLILAIASIYLEVKVDERIAKVTTLLPGYNCGACGCPGCSGLAELLVNGDEKHVSRCKVSKPAQRASIKEYLDTTPGLDGKITVVDL